MHAAGSTGDSAGDAGVPVAGAGSPMVCVSVAGGSETQGTITMTSDSTDNLIYYKIYTYYNWLVVEY